MKYGLAHASLSMKGGEDDFGEFQARVGDIGETAIAPPWSQRLLTRRGLRRLGN
jgi:hypothetical protein